MTTSSQRPNGGLCVSFRCRSAFAEMQRHGQTVRRLLSPQSFRRIGVIHISHTTTFRKQPHCIITSNMTNVQKKMNKSSNHSSCGCQYSVAQPICCNSSNICPNDACIMDHTVQSRDSRFDLLHSAVRVTCFLLEFQGTDSGTLESELFVQKMIDIVKV